MLVVAQQVNKTPDIYGIRGFITVFTRIRHWTLSWVRRIKSTLSHPISLRSIVILSSYRHLDRHKFFSKLCADKPTTPSGPYVEMEAQEGSCHKFFPHLVFFLFTHLYLSLVPRDTFCINDSITHWRKAFVAFNIVTVYWAIFHFCRVMTMRRHFPRSCKEPQQSYFVLIKLAITVKNIHGVNISYL
jgi:hypothetical protein